MLMLVVPPKIGSPGCDPSPLTPQSPLLLFCKHGTMSKWELPVSTGVSLASLFYRVMERSPPGPPTPGIPVIVKAHLGCDPPFGPPTDFSCRRPSPPQWPYKTSLQPLSPLAREHAAPSLSGDVEGGH